MLYMTDNVVLRPRQFRLGHATRPFRARGCRAARCQNCLLSRQNCLCATIKPKQANSRFCLIMFGAEPPKPSNNHRLIADILPDTQAFLWLRTEIDPGLLDAINDPARQHYVVFPASYADPERPVFSSLPVGGKPPPFIILCSMAPGRKLARYSVKAPI